MLNDPRFTVLFLVLMIVSNSFAGLSALASDETLSQGVRLTFIILGVVGGSISGVLSAFGISARLLRAPDANDTKSLPVLLALLLLPAAFTQTACPKPKPGQVISAKVIIPAISAGVDEFMRAIPDLGLDEGEARVLRAAFGEAKLSEPLAQRAAGFPNLSRGDRARLAADVADYLSAAAARLSDQNVGLKSDTAKQKLSEYRARVRLAVTGLRVYAAAIDAGENPDAEPTPTPTPKPVN
jgi:hypothetical protein